MRVLIACEFSGIVREAFAARGHESHSCDLIPTELPCGPGAYHHEEDVFGGVMDELYFDLMIFHWPCTYMLNSGVRWFTTIPRKPKPGILYGPARFEAMQRDARCFRRLLECDIPKICGENPTMCGQAQRIIGHKWTQRINPWEFGHPEQKATFLWLKNLPPLKPTNNVYDEMMKLPRKERERVHYASPGKNRSMDRSRTYSGWAEAMAEQWG